MNAEIAGNEGLIQAIGDEELIKFFYLRYPVVDLAKKLVALTLEPAQDDSVVPFTAAVRGYRGAYDSEGFLWLIKGIEVEEVYQYLLCEIAYLIDHRLATLAAPTIMIKKGDEFFRATKVVKHADQISGYNYLESPFIQVLLKDLINRWLLFDEDRNPNNYMVIHNSKTTPFVVAIDYNKADLESECMKITGNPDQFGWYRTEKTRFLTLLKPSNFENCSIEDFEDRLGLMMDLPPAELREICMTVFEGRIDGPEERADSVVANLTCRREYIDGYFRTWFKKRNMEKVKREREEGSMYGEALLQSYIQKGGH
jgi:hypothetical protein